jgi:hypothetical protein
MNWKVYGRNQSWPNLRDHPSIFLEELRKTIKTCQNIWSLSWGLLNMKQQRQHLATTFNEMSTDNE